MIPLSKTAGKVYHLEWLDPEGDPLFGGHWELVDHPKRQTIYADVVSPKLELAYNLAPGLVRRINNLMGIPKLSVWNPEDFEEDDQIQVNPPEYTRLGPFRMRFEGTKLVLVK